MEKTTKTSGDDKATDDISGNIFQISSPISNPDITPAHQSKTGAHTSSKLGTLRRSKVAASVVNKDGSGSSGWHRSSDDNRR